ncbi:MAG TPA: hypothetical protein VGR07_04975, partial [Thermoanaerobaculia bacterium]|nr:hypothetical protein [Thermoanaerobaculia bacterium]
MRGRPLLVWGLLVLILAASVVPRLPWLANAAATFNSDEAVNALVVQHLLNRGELTLYNWDTHYYGIVEGLLAVPFLATGFAVPLAAKLGSLAGFLALVVGVFLLGRRRYGPGAGLAAAALLAGFSPQAVQWSVLASGGYTLVVAWGTLTFLAFDRCRAAPSRARLFGLGFMVGFGLYIYELFLVYVATLAGAWVVAALPWTLPGRAARGREVRALPRALGSAALFVAGCALGWAPRLSLLALGAPAAGKRPIYSLASHREALANLRLLVTQCIPALLGIDPAGDPRLRHVVGQHPWPLSATLGLLVAAVYAAAWLAGAVRVGSRVRGRFRRSPGELGGLDGETLLVLLVPVVGMFFVLSRNPVDALANRYLLPWLTSLPVLAGALLVRLGRLGRPAQAAAWALGAVLVAFPLVQIARWHEDAGYLDAHLHLLHPPEPLAEVLRYLRQEGI